MSLLKKRKFRVVLFFFVSYLFLVAFSLAASNRAPVRNNESLIITDYATGVELDDIPYGNHSFKATVKDSIVLHAPVSLMSGESFHVKYKAVLEDADEAIVVTDLSASEYNLSDCAFETTLHEGDNIVEGDLFFDKTNHPEDCELNIYCETPGIEVLIEKPHFVRVENIRVGYLAYSALAFFVIFLMCGFFQLVREMKAGV